MKYSSKIDTFYTVFIVLIGILGIIISDLFFILGFWYVSIFVFLLFSFFYYLFFTLKVVLEKDKLIIMIGFFKKSIYYKDIKEIKQTKNALLSFSTSLSRIGIRTGSKVKAINYIYISPENSEDFLHKLQANIDKLNEIS